MAKAHGICPATRGTKDPDLSCRLDERPFEAESEPIASDRDDGESRGTCKTLDAQCLRPSRAPPGSRPQCFLTHSIIRVLAAEYEVTRYEVRPNLALVPGI